MKRKSNILILILLCSAMLSTCYTIPYDVHGKHWSEWQSKKIEKIDGTYIMWRKKYCKKCGVVEINWIKI